MPTHAEAVALFARRRDAWLQGDLEGYLALWAPDMRFRSPVHREPLDRAAFGALVRDSFAAARPLEFEFATIATSGDTVLAEWRIAIERGGRRIEWWGMSTAVIRGGLIVWWREYWNPADLA
jgi:ketosteroid isomerase-like protein